jgi:hypothetical protein
MEWDNVARREIERQNAQVHTASRKPAPRRKSAAAKSKIKSSRG